MPKAKPKPKPAATIGRPKKARVLKMVSFRMREDEVAAFQGEAERRGIPMSVWLRQLGRKALGMDPDS